MIRVMQQCTAASIVETPRTLRALRYQCEFSKTDQVQMQMSAWFRVFLFSKGRREKTKKTRIGWLGGKVDSKVTPPWARFV